jgi:phage regulator Rha-like protein
VFNQAVKRNRRRFPEDFMFRLTLAEGRELERLRSQIVTPKRGQHRKYAPYAFTEQGIAMLSSVLNSERAILVNIAIIRTFVRLRQLLATHEELARRLDELAWRQNEQGQQIQEVFSTIQSLIEAPAEETAKRRYGFPTNRSGLPEPG